MKKRTLRDMIMVVIGATLVSIVVFIAKVEHLSALYIGWQTIIHYVSPVAPLFTAVSAVIATMQYKNNARIAAKKFRDSRTKEALNLVEEYRIEILKPYKAIKYIYKKTKILDIIETIDTKKMINFDQRELKDLLEQTKLDDLKKVQKSELFFECFLEANQIYKLNFDVDFYKEIEGQVSIDKQYIIISFMENLVVDLLNRLECFATHFAYQIADDRVIYSLVYQSYLEIVGVLYYQIAKDNALDEPKKYVNLTDLYHKWCERSLREQKERIAQIRGTT